MTAWKLPLLFFGSILPANYISINDWKYMKEKVRSFILLVVLTMPFLVTYSWIQYRKISIRNEFEMTVQNEVNEQLMVILKFHKNEVDKKLRFEHINEFEYNSKMYDVIRITSSADSICFFCIQDAEETSLNKILSALITNPLKSDPISREKETKLNDFYKTLYFSKNVSFDNPPFNLTKMNPFYLQIKSSDLKSKIYTPPKNCLL